MNTAHLAAALLAMAPALQTQTQAKTATHCVQVEVHNAWPLTPAPTPFRKCP